MEKEFLQGMNWNLSVQMSEYQHWKNLLDGFIIARQREARPMRRPYYPPHYSSHTVLHTPSQAYIPSMPVDPFYEARRGRSTSPSAFSPPSINSYPSPAAQRKRSAYDAFASDVPTSLPYEIQYPTRKVIHPLPPPPPLIGRAGGPSSVYNQAGLARSASLNRQIARIPTGQGRRGSADHVYAAGGPEVDLRHMAVGHAQQVRSWSHEGPGWQMGSTLVAPFEGNLASDVPPEVSCFPSSTCVMLIVYST
jgi:hypothetical protein